MHRSCSIALKHVQRPQRAARPAGCPQSRVRLRGRVTRRAHQSLTRGADRASRRAARPDRLPHWPKSAALTSSRAAAPPAMQIRDAPPAPCTTGVIRYASCFYGRKMRNFRSNCNFVSTPAPELLDRTEACPTILESGWAGWLSSATRSSWLVHRLPSGGALRRYSDQARFGVFSLDRALDAYFF